MCNLLKSRIFVFRSDKLLGLRVLANLWCTTWSRLATGLCLTLFGTTFTSRSTWLPIWRPSSLSTLLVVEKCMFGATLGVRRKNFKLRLLHFWSGYCFIDGQGWLWVANLPRMGFWSSLALNLGVLALWSYILARICKHNDALAKKMTSFVGRQNLAIDPRNLPPRLPTLPICDDCYAY